MPQQGLNELPIEGIVGLKCTDAKKLKWGNFISYQKTILVLFRGLFYTVKAPNCSYQERRFRPYDTDLAIIFRLL